MTTLNDIVEFCEKNCHVLKTCENCKSCTHKELIIKLMKGL